MNRASVSSSNLAPVGYDPGQRILEVAFHSGAVYQYHNVAPNVHAGLMAASSHGGYLDTFIKKMGYRYRRVQ